MNTEANVGSAWLFAGYRAGQRFNPGYLRTKMRDSGFHLLGARNAIIDFTQNERSDTASDFR